MSQRPIRVAFVAAELGLGGTQRGLVSFATRLDRERFSPRVITLAGGGPREGTLRAAGVPVVTGCSGEQTLAHELEGSDVVHVFRHGIAEPLVPAAARRAQVPVLIEGNIFENTWGGFSQAGYSVLLTPKNQAGVNGTNLCPICAVTDVTIRFNTISHAGAGISLANVTSANNGTALYGARYSIHDVTIDDISISKYKGNGNLVMVLSGWATNSLNNVSVNHITGFPDPVAPILYVGNSITDPPMYGFTFTNNLIGQVLYPVWTTGGGTSNCASSDVPITIVNACFTSYKFLDNAIVASGNFPAAKWPTSNYFPTSVGAIQFVNFNGGNGGDYHLASSSPYKNAASDGKDVGADVTAIQSYIAGVY